jgi:hypothetical protein
VVNEEDSFACAALVGCCTRIVKGLGSGLGGAGHAESIDEGGGLEDRLGFLGRRI